MTIQEGKSTDNTDDRDDPPCPPSTDVIITPPGEVSLILIGAAFGLTLGFALGALFGARVGNK